MSQIIKVNFSAVLILIYGASCNSPPGEMSSADREKQIVEGHDYTREDACWGGASLQSIGIWIPVKLAIDKSEHFTKVGILSRTCQVKAVNDFVKKASPVPPHFVSEWQSEFFPFVFTDVIDHDKLLGSSKLITSVSTTSVRYSENVVFSDGFVKIGRPVKSPIGEEEFFNVVEIASSPH